MASPIAHSFAGFWTFFLLLRQCQIRLAEQWRQYLPQFFVLVLLANLPDVDFFIALGAHANQLHRGFTHSLAAAVVVSLTVSCLWRIAPGFWRSAILYFAAYGSHLLIDSCTGSTLGWTHSGSGIPLFWPWPQNFSSPLILIFGVQHRNLRAIFSLDNVWSCTYELLIFGAITAVLILWKRKLKSRTSPPRPGAAARPLLELEHHS